MPTYEPVLEYPSVNELPYTLVEISGERMLNFHNGALLTHTVEQKVIEILRARGINAFSQPPRVLGAGPADYLTALQHWASQHQLIIGMVKRLPFILKLIRWLFRVVERQYEQRLMPSLSVRPACHVELNVHTQSGGDDFTRRKFIIDGLEEVVESWKEMTASIEQTLPTIDFRYKVTVRAGVAREGVIITNLRKEVITLRKVIRSARNELLECKTVTYVIYKPVSFIPWVIYRLLRNTTMF